MAKHPEHEEKHAVSDNKKTADNKTADESIPLPKPPSRAALVFLKLKFISNFFTQSSPVIAILALIIAVIAVTNNRSIQAQLDIAIGNSESLSASKIEFEKLKIAVAADKALQEDERKKQDELSSEIIRNITNLQIKMKIYPTLEEQMNQSSSAVPLSQSAPLATTTR